MKVIMFTAMDGPNASQAFVEAGASAFVSKLASADLLSTIKRLCATEATLVVLTLNNIAVSDRATLRRLTQFQR